MTEFNNFNNLLATKQNNHKKDKDMILYDYNRGVINMEYIMSSESLASYIVYLYEKEYHKTISPIKLQKALYFTFAYWPGFIGKSKKGQYVEEQIDLSPYLFEEEFEAWTYGPVLPTIYNKYKDNKLEIIKEHPKELSISDTLKETIDSILKDTFEISDFKLVALSHEDKVWQMNYNEDDENHNIIIKREDILDEYTEKSFG